jgi:hypothetical protein
VTSVFVENRLEFWRGLASVVLRSGESPRRRAARSLDCRQFQLAVNLKTGKLGVAGSLSTSRESAMARANMPGRNHIFRETSAYSQGGLLSIVSHPNRTGGFPASGSRTRRHAFAHGLLHPRAVRRTRP